MTTFHAMGTEVTVLAPERDEAGELALAAEIARVFAEDERRFSRFRDESELASMHRARGPVRVSRPLFEALRDARAWVERTRGLFDPGVGAALAAAGYDRSFSPGALDRDAPPAPTPRASFRQVILDEVTRSVARPNHVAVDLGGFVKGRAVDRAARRASGTFAIDAGGDAVLRGGGPDGDGWLVEVEDPRDPARVLLVLRVRDRSVATSAPNRRRWRRGAREQHHLIDPRTGAPARSDLAQATVVAETTEAADVLAKTAFLLGAREARQMLTLLPSTGGVLVHEDGAIEVVGDVEVADA